MSMFIRIFSTPAVQSICITIRKDRYVSLICCINFQKDDSNKSTGVY